MSTTEAREAKHSLEARILALPEEDLTESRHSKVFVDVPEGPAPTARTWGSSLGRR